MATFTYVCPAGHETDRDFTVNEKRTRTTRCGVKKCGRRAEYSVAATFRGSLAVRADLEPHWNDTFQRAISSRRQLVDAQRRLRGETGREIVNYDRTRTRSSNWMDKAQGKDQPTGPSLPHGITPDMRVRDHPAISGRHRELGE